MDERNDADSPPQHRRVDRRAFLNGAGRFAAGARSIGALTEVVKPNDVSAQQGAKVTDAASARILDQLQIAHRLIPRWGESGAQPDTPKTEDGKPS